MTRITALLALLFAAATLYGAPAWAGPRDVSHARKLLETGEYDGALALARTALAKRQGIDDIVALHAIVDDALFEIAREKGTAASYAEYLVGKPDGPHARAARNALCVISYAAAVGVSNEQGLLTFVDEHPTCPQAVDARKLIVERAYQAALADHSMYSLRAVLMRFPDGPGAPDVLAAEEEAHYLEVVAAPNAPAIAAYFSEHPAGANAASVVALQNELLEQANATGASETPIDLGVACADVFVGHKVAVVDASRGTVTDYAELLCACVAGPTGQRIAAAMSDALLNPDEIASPVNAKLLATMLGVDTVVVLRATARGEGASMWVYSEGRPAPQQYRLGL